MPIRRLGDNRGMFAVDMISNEGLGEQHYPGRAVMADGTTQQGYKCGSGDGRQLRNI